MHTKSKRKYIVGLGLCGG